MEPGGGGQEMGRPMERDRRMQILDAARTLLQEDPGAMLTVRAVAERAGIGASTLRHYYPTQRQLHEAVLAAAFDTSASDLRIHDATLPARQRLRECLLQLLPPLQPAEAGVEHWIRTLDSVFGSASTTTARHGWSAFVVRTRSQIAGWLQVLADEGAVTAGLEDRGARFLLTVIDGLSLSRIIPVARPTPEEESAILDDALTQVLRPR